jgi:hypothetical protein
MYYLTGADTGNKSITRLRRKHHTALRKMGKARGITDSEACGVDRFPG